MKLEIKGGLVIAAAESKSESVKLFEVAYGIGAESKAVTAAPKKRKIQYKKPCPECGETFKGAIGVGIHRNKVHGIKAGESLAIKDNTYGSEEENS